MSKKCSLSTQPLRWLFRRVGRKAAMLCLLCGTVAACGPDTKSVVLSLQLTCIGEAAVCPQDGETNINLPVKLTLSNSSTVAITAQQPMFVKGIAPLTLPMQTLDNDVQISKVQVQVTDDGWCDIGGGDAMVGPNMADRVDIQIKTGPSRQCALSMDLGKLPPLLESSAPQPAGAPAWSKPDWKPLSPMAMGMRLAKGTQIRLRTDSRGDDRVYLAGWSFKKLLENGQPGDSSISLCKGSADCIFSLNESYQVFPEQGTNLCDPAKTLCEKRPGVPLRALAANESADTSADKSTDIWVSSDSTTTSTLIYGLGKGIAYVPQVVLKDESTALHGLWAPAAGKNMLAVGSNGLIASRSISSEWTKNLAVQMSFGTATLYAVYMNKDMSEGWAAGSGGLILRFEHGMWKRQLTDVADSGTFYGIGQDATGVGWAAGTSGLWKLVGGTWRKQSGFKEIYTLWINQDGSLGFALGRTGSAYSILQLSGSSWTRRSLKMPGDAGEVEINSIMGLTANSLFIVGRARAEPKPDKPWRGFLGKVDIVGGAASCPKNYALEQLPLYAVLAAGDELWAAGDQGTLLHATGSQWQQLQAGRSTDDLHFESVPMSGVGPNR